MYAAVNCGKVVVVILRLHCVVSAVSPRPAFRVVYVRLFSSNTFMSDSWAISSRNGTIGSLDMLMVVELWTWLGNQAVLYQSDQTKVRTSRLGLPDVLQSFARNSIDMNCWIAIFFSKQGSMSFQFFIEASKMRACRHGAASMNRACPWRGNWEVAGADRTPSPLLLSNLQRLLDLLHGPIPNKDQSSGPCSVSWWSWVHVYPIRLAGTEFFSLMFHHQVNQAKINFKKFKKSQNLETWII